MEQGVKGPEREEMRAGDGGEEALAERLEKKRVQGAGGSEADPETALQCRRDGPAGVGPRGVVAGIGEERGEGGLGALEGEGHAVAGEGWDEAEGVAKAENIGLGRERGVVEGGDGAAGVGVGCGGRDASGKRGEAGGGEVGGQERGAGCGEGAAAEEPADVDGAGFGGGEADVGLVAEVEFEVAGEREAVDVEFETEPRGVAAGAAGGKDAAGGGREVGSADVGAEIAAGGGERSGEAGVEGVAAEAEGGRGENLNADEFFVVKPSDVAVVEGVGEKRREAEAGDGGGGEAGDEIAADAVARIAAGFEKGDGDAGTAEGEAEGEAGEATADDLDGAGRGHARRSATR